MIKDFKIAEVPNFLYLAHTEDGISINNVSNPMRIDEINDTERFHRDFHLVLKSLQALWLNRPDLTQENESLVFRNIAETFEAIVNENKN